MGVISRFTTLDIHEVEVGPLVTNRVVFKSSNRLCFGLPDFIFEYLHQVRSPCR
jgi:hypothetical protein